ncbi:MAG: RecQ family ATP-dependent DNA helicase, partial [Muribaculaceae bacterium]|nr:RecQ family ATP-dependent DNA helicase [Muribaculaceae bacterium]
MVNANASRYGFVDIEIGLQDKKIHDIGAIRWDGAVYHSASKRELMAFFKDVDFVCGHNIINHDAKYLFGDGKPPYILVDTLFLSPLLFPERPYHNLVKDDKLISDQLNDPVNDCEKARDLLMSEVAKWKKLPESKQLIFPNLLQGIDEFKGFLAFVNATAGHPGDLANMIRSEYKEKICQHADIENAIQRHPCELAYALALIDTADHRSITPPWVLHNYPNVENLVRLLRHTKCS